MTSAALRWIRVVVLAAIFVFLVIVMVREAQRREATTHLIVDAAQPTGWLRPIWGTANVPIPYRLGDDDWLREHAPWFREQRLVAREDPLDPSNWLGWRNPLLRPVRLFETPTVKLSEFRKERRPALLPGRRRREIEPLSVEVEEFGIDSDVQRAFAARAHEPIEKSLFAASWHAEALRSFLDDGDVAAAMPWLHEVVDMPGSELTPTGAVYAMLGLLTGQLRDRTTEEGGIGLEPTGDENGLPKIWTFQDAQGLPVENTSLEALASADRGTVRVLVVHHSSAPVLAGEAPHEEAPASLDLTVAGLNAGTFRVRLASAGGAATPSAELEWFVSCRTTPDGKMVLVRNLPVTGNSVWFFEIAPDESCKA